MNSDPKYGKFIDTLTNAGFFKGVEAGTPEYEARIKKAQATYVAKYGNQAAAPAPAPAAPEAASEAAPAPAEISEEDKVKAEQLKGEGNKLLSAKKFDEAVEMYSAALKVRPGHAIYLCNRAAALSYLDRHEEARADAETALEKDPGYVKGYSRLGLALFKLGLYQEAVEVYEKGLGVDSENASLKSGLHEAQTKLAAEAAPAAGAPGGMADIMGMAQGLMQDPNAMANLQSMMGGMMGGGEGGQPDLGALLNNPMMQNMAQQMMQDPAMMQNMMGMMGGMGGMPGAPGAGGNNELEDEEETPSYDEVN
eukprot:TRINITY_DN711_c0_g1_i5.p1 TRINITY_DN711_c0_g1~~TRINITY_DN711_c0_g1_i5.p1  ORF type:complete len:309 (-),score=108.29 TRINITY_DN711_c0_g1_i5:451-1377(-)